MSVISTFSVVPKTLLRRFLDRLGLRVVRVRHTFGLNPLVDLRIYFPDRPLHTILDVGANVGVFALAAARHHPSANVLAFEPIHRTFDRLLENTRGQERITCFPWALGSSQGKAIIHLKGDSQWNSLTPSVNVPTESGGEEVVFVRTIDGLMEEGCFAHVDLLKTDTEGFDIEVLKGARALLEEGRLPFLLSEVAFDRTDMGHTNFFELHEYLRPFGFQLFAIYDQTILPEARHGGYCNALFVSQRAFHARAKPD